MSFTRLQPEDFLISADSVAAGAWTGNVPKLTEFYTSSVQEAATSGQYFLDIYQSESTETAAETQFAIAYGDSLGSGSLQFDSTILGRSPSSVVYGQFQNIILGDENLSFTFDDVTPSDQYFYALSINRARYKGSILPGALTLNINNELVLTDDSATTNTVSFNEAGRVFQIKSGSAGSIYTDGSYNGNSAASGSYGLFLPDIGVILLNGPALDVAAGDGGGVGLGTARSENANDENPVKLFDMLNTGADFTLNSEEKITSDYVFIRARNAEYNYSENP